MNVRSRDNVFFCKRHAIWTGREDDATTRKCNSAPNKEQGHPSVHKQCTVRSGKPRRTSCLQLARFHLGTY